MTGSYYLSLYKPMQNVQNVADLPDVQKVQNINGENDKDVAILNKITSELPKRYKVLLHNDDYTTMEFVVMILQRIFHKSVQEARDIMLAVHSKGIGICGIYTYEVAETKVVQVKRFSKDHGFPLKCTCEPE